MTLKWVVWLIPLALAVICWQARPFPNVIAVQQSSMAILNAAQRQNIQTAAQALNGRVIQPGEVFSFNRTVGPRTVIRGYAAAPSYLEGETPLSPGGGICLLSSLIYQTALAAGMQIIERVPHLRTIRTVPPGLDATAWYGQADLRFKNMLPYPVQLTVSNNGPDITIRLLGHEDRPTMAITRQVTQQTPQAVQVQVFRGRQLISRDLYRLSAS